MIEPITATKRDIEAQEASIRDFDEWFRYAEEIGQDRLGSFLFTASIILAAFATLYADHIFALALVLSFSGAFFSLVWVVIGTRQGKFHEMLERQIDRRLQEWDAIGPTGRPNARPDLFPIWHVRQMKRDAALDEAGRTPGQLTIPAIREYIRTIRNQHLTAGAPERAHPELGHVENIFATRKLLWIVPIGFLGLYVTCSAFALFALLKRAVGAG
jgi:hypothetical protein